MPSRDAKTAAVRAELAALRSEVSVRLQKDLQALRADGAQLDFTDRTSVVAARDRCHTLAGTALTFSYESLGRQLRSLEYRLESGLDADEFPQGRVSEILCERHTMMLPRSMYATQEEDAGGHAGH